MDKNDEVRFCVYRKDSERSLCKSRAPFRQSDSSSPMVQKSTHFTGRPSTEGQALPQPPGELVKKRQARDCQHQKSSENVQEQQKQTITRLLRNESQTSVPAIVSVPPHYTVLKKCKCVHYYADVERWGRRGRQTRQVRLRWHHGSRLYAVSQSISHIIMVVVFVAAATRTRTVMIYDLHRFRRTKLVQKQEKEGQRWTSAT